MIILKIDVDLIFNHTYLHVPTNKCMHKIEICISSFPISIYSCVFQKFCWNIFCERGLSIAFVKIVFCGHCNTSKYIQYTLINKLSEVSKLDYCVMRRSKWSASIHFHQGSPGTSLFWGVAQVFLSLFSTLPRPNRSLINSKLPCALPPGNFIAKVVVIANR